MVSFARTVPMAAGAVMANLLSGGVWLMTGAPASRASWSWQCTAYVGSSSASVVYMDPGADNGPTCSDGSTKLTCSCAVDPCKDMNQALPSDLVCAGAGADTSNGGCFKLHHSYGMAPEAVSMVAGRGSGTLTDACGAAGVIKVYGHAGGLDMLLGWGKVAQGKNDSSVVPANATQCQELCASDSACKFFTFNDQGLSNGAYGFFRGLCILQEELTCNGEAFSHYHGMISGPASCSPTPAAPTPAPTPSPQGADASGALRSIASLASTAMVGLSAVVASVV